MSPMDLTTRSWCRIGIVALLASGIWSCGGGGDSPPAAAPPLPPPPPPSALTPSEQLNLDLAGLDLADFYRTSFAALLRRTPQTVLAQGLDGPYALIDVELDNPTREYAEETAAMVQVVADRLADFDRSTLDAAGRRDYDVYTFYLEDRLSSAQFLDYPFVATYLNIGIANQTERFFTDLHPLRNETDAQNYVARLVLVERQFTQLSERLLNQRDAGIVEPSLSLGAAINRIRSLSFGPADSHAYFRSARDRLRAVPGLDAARLTELTNAARNAVESSVIPAYAQLVATLTSLQAAAPQSIGVGQYPDGAQYYEQRLRHHTTTALDAPAIHALGLAELTRIQARMRVLFDQLGYPQNQTLEQLYARVAVEGGSVAATSVLPTYQAIVLDARNRLSAAFDIFPAAPVEVLADPFGGFYIGPSFDGTRPGAFYAGTSNAEPRYLMKSLAYHEAVPGHHTQIALSMEASVPDFRKLARYTGFVEGWALYAERLAVELGWYDGDIFGELGQLQYEALRASRLVMDTGIHYYGWSFAEASQFNRDNTGFSQSASDGAAARYSVWPGQATGYMVGMLEILRLRQKARDALGVNFDLVAFHRLLLGNGAVPLTLLEGIVDDWIAAQ